MASVVTAVWTDRIHWKYNRPLRYIKCCPLGELLLLYVAVSKDWVRERLILHNYVHVLNLQMVTVAGIEMRGCASTLRTRE